MDFQAPSSSRHSRIAVSGCSWRCWGLSLDEFHRITEWLMLEKPSKVIKSSHSPSAAKATPLNPVPKNHFYTEQEAGDTSGAVFSFQAAPSPGIHLSRVKCWCLHVEEGWEGIHLGAAITLNPSARSPSRKNQEHSFPNPVWCPGGAAFPLWLARAASSQDCPTS